MLILIVEDTESIAQMISALVSARGHQVVRVGNGARALEAVREQSFGLVLLDINLPGGYDGFSICEHLRADERTRETRVFMISAMSDDEHRARAFAAGANMFFAKPFSPMSLLKEIDAVAGSLP
jgi:DNA-binding response OmpR family regulator